MGIEIGKQAAKLTDAVSAATAAPRDLVQKGVGLIPGRESARDRIATVARTAGLSALGGAATAYVFDPENGRRRRAIARDRAAALVRRGLRRTSDTAGAAAQTTRDHAAGAAHEARRAVSEDRPAANDQELADRVRSEVLRPAEAPKGSVSINAEAGVVYLRGEVKRPEQIKALVESAERVEGVRAVENLLHTPGTEPKMKQETEAETRRRVFAKSRRR